MPHTDDSVQPPFAVNCQEKGVGKVYLVGAGPGDPGLLTLRGRKCLERADVVLFDGLANDQLLEYAQRAECISVGKHGQLPIWTQQDINDQLVQLARAGKLVVRLKGGDPAVFARTAEELDRLILEKIPFEVVPGITAALAAASYVGIPITHRQHASAVALITGQQQTAEQPQPIDWEALSKFPGTIVFYMGVTTVAEWTSRLLAAGKPTTTPVAIVRRCSWSDQTVVRCQLGQVVEQLTPASKMRPPVIVIIGEVASLGENFDWFTSRPLHGCGVLVTRAAGEQANDTAEQLRELGADVFQQPALQVVAPKDLSSLDQAIRKLVAGRFQGITFSSSNGVDGLLQRAWELGHDARVFAGARLAAVGPATAERLQHYGLRCDVLPTEVHSAAGLLETLGPSLADEHWLAVLTNRSRDTLSAGLRQLGANVDECVAYETLAVEELKPSVAAALAAGRIQLVTITSSFVAEAVHALLAEHRDELQPICLSEAAAATLNQLGWPAAAVSKTHTSASMIDTMVAAWRARDSD